MLLYLPSSNNIIIIILVEIVLITKVGYHLAKGSCLINFDVLII